jgi:GT2 family glycosyltransferase/tetratricopeptide (TPR) repeat protein
MADPGSALLHLVPPTARRIVDLDQVLENNGGDVDLRGADNSIDCVVCEHHLECVRDPAGFLERARRWLTPDGSLLACFANVRHHAAVGSLVQGKWPLPSGTGTRRPIRYFTRREIEKLFYRAGFAIEVMEAVAGEGDEPWRQRAAAGEVNAGPLHIRGLRPEDAEQLYTSHYLVRAIPAPAVDFGLTSIVILTHNQLDYTRLCVDSIRQRTDEPYELIFVDNASTDGTPEYLAGIRGAKVICNKENRGFPAAANQGIKAAAGRQVLLLNNDTVMTTGWLGRLLRALHRDPKIGLVGPCSNCVSGEQQVAVAYEDLLDLDGFAWDWGKAHNRQAVETDRLVGFCFLIRREVIDAIGLLDERFGIGCFEDDDYCRRALRAGFRAAIAGDAFVHHFGGRTFVASGTDFAEIMRKNGRLFQEKWAKEIPGDEVRPTEAPAQPDTLPRADVVIEPIKSPAKPLPAYKLEMHPAGGLKLVRANILISLCMIARDNHRTIEAALSSIKPWVDEMVVVDTGSKDDTPQIAERLGARLFHFPWCDSFSAARNESLRYARGRWIFWMDSDDTIDEVNGRGLRELASREPPPGVLGYVVQVRCPGRVEDDPATFVGVDHIKLFRNLPELRFECRIHEQILGAISRAGGTIVGTGLFIVHSGYDVSPEGQKRKLERDLRILHKEYEEDPNHPFTLFNLGMTYEDKKDYEKALGYLQKCSMLSLPHQTHLRKVYSLMIRCHVGLGRATEAWKACDKGLSLFPKDAELLFYKARLLHESGRLREAVVAYRYLLESREEWHFKSVDSGLQGCKGRLNLAAVHQQLGELEEAEQELRRVIKEAPGFGPGWSDLGEILIRRGKLPEAAQLAERLQREERLQGEALTLRVKVAAVRGDIAAAWEEIGHAGKGNPGIVGALGAFAHILVKGGNLAEAERALKEMSRLSPEDASAHFNLGIIYQRSGRPQQAVEEYRQAAALRPGSYPTYINLGHSLRECGSIAEAIRAFEEAERLDPSNPEPREMLKQLRGSR